MHSWPLVYPRFCNKTSEIKRASHEKPLKNAFYIFSLQGHVSNQWFPSPKVHNTRLDLKYDKLFASLVEADVRRLKEVFLLLDADNSGEMDVEGIKIWIFSTAYPSYSINVRSIVWRQDKYEYHKKIV